MPSSENHDNHGAEIAVIGLACRFPGARDAREFWKNLCDGVESVVFLDGDAEPSILDPGMPHEPGFVKAASFLEEADLFDAGFFDYSPLEAEAIDPQQRLFLECSWHALENAGYDPERYEGLIGVFAGASTDTYVFNLFTNRTALQGGFDSFQVGLGNDLAFLANRVSYKLNLRGPSLSVHTACSTSLVAVHLARQSLLIDECQIALAGAVSVHFPQKAGYVYRQGGVLSPDGHCRPFDAKSRGTLFGDGVGVVVLKRLEDALADGDQILAVIKGSAINNDGSLKASFTAPSVYGQTEVVLDALADAQVDPATVSYVEAHGTGTQLGDPIELRALTRAFRRHTDRKGFCAIGSVKSNFGHLDAAAGMPGLVKTVMALREGVLPPTLHFESPNPQIELADSPFVVNDRLRPWEQGNGPRRAGLSSFGVGGTNAHFVLEEPPAVEPSPAARGWQILPLSARSEEALEAATRDLAEHLARNPGINLADAAYTLQLGRRVFAHRRAVVCRDPGEASALLSSLDPQQVLSGFQESGDRGVVFLFAGGGTQYVGMGRGLYEEQPVFRRHVDRCAELLVPALGLDLRQVLYPEGDDGETGKRLEQTWIALPALFTVEYSLAQLWLSWGIKPQAMIGHSLGEYVAACLAGVFSLEDALALVVARGSLLRKLPRGAMLSVPLPEAEILEILDPDLSLAAVNSPGQCVVSGAPEAVDRMAALLTEKGIESRRLHIDAAGHSRMVEPILEEFEAVVRKFTLRPPSIPCVSNTTGTWLRPEEATSPVYWARHLRETVRFSQGIQEVLKTPNQVLLEVGPGRALTTLARMQAGEARAREVFASMRHPDDRRPDGAVLLAALGSLWIAGVPVPWERLHEEGRRRVALPAYPFERKKFWIGPGSLEAALAAAVPAGKRKDIADWFYVPAWQQAPPLPAADLSNGAPRRWLIFVDRGALGQALAAELRDAGHEVAAVVPGDGFAEVGAETWSVDPDGPESYEALVERLNALGRSPQAVVHLWSVGNEAGAPEGPEKFRQVQRTGYYSVFYLCRALARQGLSEPVRVAVVSDRLHDVSGGEGMVPEKAPLLGVCKVVSQENEHLLCRSIDVAVPAAGRRAEALAGRILAEVLASSPKPAVALRGEHRWVHQFVPRRLEADAPPLRPLRERGVYLITGGLGGVGLLLGEYLARTFRARLVLVGRSPFPAREEWDDRLAAHGEDDRTARIIRRLRSWEEAGAEVLVAQADVASEKQMREVMARATERFGAVNGVLHTAGVTSGPSLYRPFVEMGREESETQFGPKGYALYVLEELLPPDLDFCLVFSSNAGVLGGLGYVTYSAASSFLDAFASSRAGKSPFPWVSADWDGWPEETRKYSNAQTSMDQYTMTREESVEAFRRAACLAPEGQVSVPLGDFQARLALWVYRNVKPGEPEAAHPRPSIKSRYLAPTNETEATLAGIWQQVLGLEQVGIQDNFFDLGGHSLLATRLVSRMSSAFEIDFPINRFFEAPTVQGLAVVIDEMLTEREQQAGLEVLGMLSQLSDDEVRAELARLAEAEG